MDHISLDVAVLDPHDEQWHFESAFIQAAILFLASVVVWGVERRGTGQDDMERSDRILSGWIRCWRWDDWIDVLSLGKLYDCWRCRRGVATNWWELMLLRHRWFRNILSIPPLPSFCLLKDSTPSETDGEHFSYSSLLFQSSQFIHHAKETTKLFSTFVAVTRIF